MVEVSVTLFTTISTIIVVTMTTIFFCCWRKKGSGDLSERKAKKQEAKKEPSPAPATGRPENGVVSQTPSPSAFVDSNDDLGDFSAVQRETEILRSYRKPPPPKNRARQSRAPRALKSSTENLDIFTELREEENKENIVANDEVDSALLRPKSEGKEATTREARSSMLADIEQTLAALHMSEQTSGDNSPAKDHMSQAESGGEKLLKDKQEKGDQRKSNGSETVKGNSLASGDTIGSSPASVPPEVKTPTEKASPKSSPIAKPKRGPKVSPKPSPKITAKLSMGEDKPAASTNLDIPSEGKESDSLKSSDSEFQTANNSSPSPELTSSSSPKQESTIADHNPSEASTNGQEIASEATTNKNNSAEKSKDQAITDTSVTSTSETTQPDLLKSEKRNSDMVESTNNRKSPESAKVTDITEALSADTAEDPVEKVSNKTDALTSSEAEGPDGDTQATTSPPDASAAENHDTQADPNYSTAVTSTDQSEEKSASTTEHTSRSEVKGEDLSAPPEEDTKAHEPKSISPSRADGSGKQRRESAEDQSGKGKTSKIPVRAGSKTRSSPPRTLSGDKPASPTN